MTGIRLAVTTATNPTAGLEERAWKLAQELGVPYAPRRNVTVVQVFRESEMARLLIVEQRRMLLKDHEGTEYFFHPNLAFVRGLNIMRGMRDLFADATGLTRGECLLDCTLGFAGEATLGALLVGEQGRVVGLESVPELAAVTRDGVAKFHLQTKRIAEAMRRVQVVTADYRAYLLHCASNAFDVVYFDPFFGERLAGSENSVSPLAHFGNPAALDGPSLHEARRVARRRVVIKHPKHEPLPPDFAVEVTEVYTTRKNRLQYDVLPPI